MESTQIINQIFHNEMTEQGLEDLQVKYPKDLKLDMGDDETFKAGRKTRTECNDLTKKINRRRIDISNEIKKHGDDVIGQIEEIYDVVVLPFEKEAGKRKMEEAKIQKELDDLLAAEGLEINKIANFVQDSRGKDSNYIQGSIEAVDLIETEVFHKDLIHQAIEVKKTTLDSLAQLLSDTVASEKVELEREELRAKQKAADEKQRKAEKEQKITDRINKIRMQPTEFFGKSSAVISTQISTLSRFMITKEEFGDRIKEVKLAVDVVISQLKLMHTQAEQIEYVEKVEAAKKTVSAKIHPLSTAIDKKQEEIAEDYKDVVDDLPIEEATDEPEEQPLNSTVDQDIKGFLELASADKEIIEDFGHLLLSDDPMDNARALDSIRSKFDTYVSN